MRRKAREVYFHKFDKTLYGFCICRNELINGDDLALVRPKVIGEDEIKSMRVTALVDIDSLLLAINENIQEQLQLPVVETGKAQMANETIIQCKVVVAPCRSKI